MLSFVRPSWRFSLALHPPSSVRFPSSPLSPPLGMQWTYTAMMHELFGMEDGKVQRDKTKPVSSRSVMAIVHPQER